MNRNRLILNRFQYISTGSQNFKFEYNLINLYYRFILTVTPHNIYINENQIDDKKGFFQYHDHREHKYRIIYIQTYNNGRHTEEPELRNAYKRKK